MARERSTRNSKNISNTTPKRRSNTLPIRQFIHQFSDHSSSTSSNSDVIDITDQSCGNNIGIEAALQEFNANTSRARKRQKRKEPDIRACPDCKTVREIKCKGRCVPCYATYLNACKRADTSQHKKCSECKKVRPVNCNKLCVTCADKRRRLERGIVKRCKICKKICKKMLENTCFKCHKRIAAETALNELHYKNCLLCNKWASCPNDDLCSECFNKKPRQPNQQAAVRDAAGNSATRLAHPTIQSTLQYRCGVLQITSSDDEQENVGIVRKKRTNKQRFPNARRSNNVDEVITIDQEEIQEEILFQQQSTPRSLAEQLSRPSIEVSDIVINRQRDQLDIDQNEQIEGHQPISSIQSPPHQTTPIRTSFTSTNSSAVRILRNWPNMFLIASDIPANVSGPIRSPFMARTIPQQPQSNNNQVDQIDEVQTTIQTPIQPKTEPQQSINYENFEDEIMVVESQQVENITAAFTMNQNNESSTIELDSEDEERFNTAVAFKIEPNIKTEYQDFTNEVTAMSQIPNASQNIPTVFVPQTSQHNESDSLVEIMDENPLINSFNVKNERV